VVASLLCVSHLPAHAVFAGTEVTSSGDLARRVVMIESEKRLHCTATVLTPRVVLTTAPCALTARRATLVPPGGGAERYDIARVVVSPEWNPVRQGGWGTTNIGLLLLAKPLPGATGGLDAISDSPLRGGQSVWIAGFGRTFRDNTATAGKLRAAEVKLVGPLLPQSKETQGIGSGDASVDQPIASACLGDLGGGVFEGEGNERRLVGMLVGYQSPKGAPPDTCGGRSNMIRLAPLRGWLSEQVRALESWERPK
jgi:Trypsin